MLAPPGNAVHFLGRRLGGCPEILIKGAARRARPLGKVAAIVGIVDAGGAQRRFALGPVQGHAGMAVGFKGERAVGTAQSSFGNGAIASRANRHDGGWPLQIKTRERLIGRYISAAKSIAKA